jgi:hypothetical protein
METLPSHRIAEIVVEREGLSTRGSGYLVAPGWVLTAKHVIADALKIGVWFGAPEELLLEARIDVAPARVLVAPRADLALLPIRNRTMSNDEPALLGRLDRQSAIPITAVAAGFPRFKLRTAAGRPHVRIRERHDAIGMIIPGSNAKTRTYELSSLNLQPDDDPEPKKHSPWEGMSGAAVWANGRLIGVVGQHHPLEGTGSLTVRPIEALFREWERTSDQKRLAEWQGALGPALPGRMWNLWLVRPGGVRHRAIERALEVASDLAPHVLESRDSELAALEAFASSQEQWRWLQAAAFSGKTALAAWFVFHAPAGICIASCFLRRTTDENTTAFALHTLNAQLAAWSDRDGYVPATYVSERKREFTQLLTDAARACRERGRRLLIVIDGADEYDTSATGLRLRDWLPDGESLPASAALLMTSRTDRKIALPEAHPLHSHIHAIRPSNVAGKIESVARRELECALADTTGIEYPLLGFLAAASGGLSSKNLYALLSRTRTDVYTASIDTTIRVSLDRVLTQPSIREGSNERINNFAHDSLLEAARNTFADDLPTFDAQLLAWCQHFRDSGWPQNTPEYVLFRYALHLVRAGHYEELFALLSDEQWYERHKEIDPTGHSYLEGIDIIWTAAETVDETETKAGRMAVRLGVEAHCALTSASVRNLSSGVDLSLILALLDCHYWSGQQAWRVARLHPDPRERGQILAELAGHLKEPLRTAAVRDGFLAISRIADEFAKAWLLEALAPHIPESLIGDALRLARSLPSRLSDGRNPRVAALKSVLARAASLGQVRDAFEEALALKFEDSQARVLARLARELPASLKQKALRAVRDYWSVEARAKGLAGFATDPLNRDADLVNEALNAALATKSSETKSWTLCLLAPVLPDNRVDEVLAAADGLKKGNRFRLLTALAACLGKRGQWQRALGVARGIESEDDIWFVRALVVVAPSVPDPQRNDVAREMLSAAQGITDQIFLEQEFAAVAPFHSEPLLREAINFAQDLAHPDRSAETLAVLLPQLAKFGHYQQAFELALPTLDSKGWRGQRKMAGTLARLIPFLPEPLQTRACREALADANRIGDGSDRMRALAGLAGFLSEPDLRYVLESIRSIDGPAQANVLQAVVRELPDHMLPDALAIARDVPLTDRAFGQVLSSPRADAFLALAGRLPEPMRSESLQKAAEAIENIELNTERIRTSARLSRLLSVPAQVPDNVTQEAIASACAVGIGYGRLSAVTELVPYVSPSILQQVADDVHASDEQRVNRVRTTIENIRSGALPEGLWISALKEALSSAVGIEESQHRAAAMSLLAPHFSTLLRRRDPSVKLDEEQWRWYQARVIEALGPVLEPGQMPEATETALTLMNDALNRRHIFWALAPRVEKLPPVDAYSIWRTLLRPASTGLRCDLFDHLNCFLPVVLKLGDSAGASQMATAIKVTGDWWP